MLWHYVLLGLICLIAGFWLGGINGRRVKRSALLELNMNSLDLLETKNKFSGIESKYADYQRKDKLLQLTMEQLKGTNVKARKSYAQALISDTQAVNSHTQAQKSEAQLRKLQQEMITLIRQQNLIRSGLNLKAQKSHKMALQSHLRAVQAASLARKATAHLRRLENSIASKRSANPATPTPYGAGDQARTDVINQPRLVSGEKIFKQVPRSSARLAKLNSRDGANGPLN